MQIDKTKARNWMVLGCATALCLSFYGCTSTGNDQKNGTSEESDTTELLITAKDSIAQYVETNVGDAQFAYPEVPETIKDPRRRLNYTLEHLWDNWDFDDTSDGHWAAGEQGFADFINLLQYAEPSLANRVVKRYLERGFAKADQRLRYENMFERYLGRPDSPLHNEVVYAYFLKNMLPFYDPAKEMALRERTSYRLSIVSKNNPGKEATDFEYIDRNGRHGRLSKVQGELIVMLFNDPDCKKCEELMNQLTKEKRLQREGITVLAIYPDVNTLLWKQQKRKLPANWIDAYSPEGTIMQKQLYTLAAMPSIYLLDGQHRVMMKDVDAQVLMNVLDEYQRRQRQLNSPESQHNSPDNQLNAPDNQLNSPDEQLPDDLFNGPDNITFNQ